MAMLVWDTPRVPRVKAEGKPSPARHHVLIHAGHKADDGAHPFAAAVVDVHADNHQMFLGGEKRQVGVRGKSDTSKLPCPDPFSCEGCCAHKMETPTPIIQMVHLHPQREACDHNSLCPGACKLITRMCRVVLPALPGGCRPPRARHRACSSTAAALSGPRSSSCPTGLQGSAR